MSADDAYHLDIDHFDVESAAETVSNSRRRWIGIMLECCDTYTRIYPNASNTAYEGPCPRCGQRIRVPIGPQGTNVRFFRAS